MWVTRALAIPITAIVYSIAFFMSVTEMSIRSRLLPQIVIVSLWVLLAVQIATEMRSRKLVRRAPSIAHVWRKWHRTFGVIALTALFTVAINTVGYYVSLPVFVVAALLLLGVRSVRAIALAVIGFQATSYFLFNMIMGIRVP
jgi:hypothetical protein